MLIVDVQVHIWSAGRCFQVSIRDRLVFGMTPQSIPVAPVLRWQIKLDRVRSGLVWGFFCQPVVLGCAESFLFGAGKAVFRPVACNQVPGARGRGQGTETLAELGGLPP